MAKAKWQVYGEITGPVIMIGFGSIGRGTLPLIERHFKFDKSRMVVIDPSDANRKILDDKGIRFIKEAITKDNYKKVLGPLLKETEGQPFIVNLSVDTGSLDLMRYAREHGALYIDTVVEPWLGFYFDEDADNASRTNYALRETVRAEKRKNPGGTTAVSCCGANPGMVSWFVKKALVDLATELKLDFTEPAADDRHGWAKLMKKPASGVSTSPNAIPNAQKSRNLSTHSGIHGPSKGSSPKAYNRQSLAGAAMKNGCPRMPASRRRATRPQFSLNSRAAIPVFVPGVRRSARNMACSSPTMKRSPSPIFHAARQEGQA